MKGAQYRYSDKDMALS